MTILSHYLRIERRLLIIGNFDNSQMIDSQLVIVDMHISDIALSVPILRQQRQLSLIANKRFADLVPDLTQ